MLTAIVARLRSLLAGSRERSRIEQDMSDEMQLHLQLRAADLERAGLTAVDARLQARREFGNIDAHKQLAREARKLHWFDALTFSSLDIKLGVRMLMRYPGLTVVGGLAVAFAIAIGSTTFEIINQFVRPSIPLYEGDRLIGIRTINVATRRLEQQVTANLFAWRQQLTSMDDIGAFAISRRNLLAGSDALSGSETIEIAEISASAFHIAHVAPMLGRTLTEADERIGAAPVIVIGYDTWQSRFAADPGVLGRMVRLGSMPMTIVGVMPKGFKFPIAQDLWVPLRLDAQMPYGEGPAIQVFGKLAPGATLETANNEMSAISARLAKASPQANANLRFEVLTYAQAQLNSGMNILAVLSVNVFLGMLLVVVFSNVALLMFARAATRESEVIVRTALGASRARIVIQLFAEALVLGTVGSIVGLIAAGAALRWAMGALISTTGSAPFWYSATLHPQTLAYAAVLTLFGAGIAGVLPALKVTAAVDSGLRRIGTRSAGFRFGGVWTAVIITQIALTVAFPVTAFFIRRDAGQLASLNVGFQSAEYLSMRLHTATADSNAAGVRALEARLESHEQINSVTFADRLPGAHHGQRKIEVEGGATLRPGLRSTDSIQAMLISTAHVTPDYFESLGASILRGNTFALDPSTNANSVIVNEALVDELFGGSDPVGRRIRFALEDDEDPLPGAPKQPGPWLSILGVVRNLGMTTGGDALETGAGLYQATVVEALAPRFMIVQRRGQHAALANEIRALATSVDPDLRVESALPLNRVADEELSTIRFWFQVVIGVSIVTLMLSLAGIYSVMAFTVARRTREIGIRVALGATKTNVTLSVLRRPIGQVLAGLAAGVIFAVAFSRMIIGSLTLTELSNLGGYAMLMALVCSCACVVPIRRALAVQPTEALREEL